MVKVEWGNKRACLSCGARFYDLRNFPIVCPKCGVAYEIHVSGRKRRAGAPDSKAAIIADDISLVDDLDLPDALGDDLEDDDALIEDASDLGEDLDDMTEVIDHVDEGDER